jgi:hypothetical protein
LSGSLMKYGSGSRGRTACPRPRRVRSPATCRPRR